MSVNNLLKVITRGYYYRRNTCNNTSNNIKEIGLVDKIMYAIYVRDVLLKLIVYVGLPAGQFDCWTTAEVLVPADLASPRNRSTCAVGLW